MQVLDIVNIVKAKLDELTPYNEALVISGVSYADQTINYINQVLPEAVREITMQAPTHLLPQSELKIIHQSATSDNPNKFIIENAILTLILPASFIKLAWLKLPGWASIVTETITPEHPLYIKQTNKHTMGTPSRPIVVKHKDADGKLKLKCYSTGTTVIPVDAEISIGAYISALAATDVPDILIDALTSLCAAKVLIIYGKIKEAELNLKQYQTQLAR